MTAPVIELTGLTKTYNIGTPVETEVLHGLDLSLMEGEFAALIGPSGSGKSTLLNIIGLLERPTGGRLAFAGRNTATLPEAEITQLRGRSIGFVFQFHHLLPAFSALENVMMPAIIAHGAPSDALEATALQLLDAVGLKAHAYKKPGELSGGQQQRVAIARALALKPRLILADEPTGNLDTRTADDIFALLREFNRDSHCACLIVTHDPRLAARCDRVIRLVDGRIADDLPTA
ncbi:ABC transporter ATP-binding protein [Zoogloea sp.]|uniref:ABC transporter ATP-binding protein n=1 Tax=Zoogloea sp. TaxID=49181 RepID=UPI002619BA06|nr:ABC transporter ATP-binding protein [Zoogloea sp.]